MPEREARLRALAAARWRIAIVLTVAMIRASPAIQVDVLGRAAAVFPLKNPALVTVPLAFAVGVVVSLLTPEQGAAGRYERVVRRIVLGGSE